MRSTSTRWIAAAAAALLVHAAAAAPVAPLEVLRAEVRPRSTPSAIVLMTVRANADAKLIAVYTPAARFATLQQMTRTGEAVRIDAVASITLAQGTPEVFAVAPGRYHVLLHGLEGPLLEGAVVPLRLRLMLTPGGKRVDVLANARVAAGRTEAHADEH